MNAKKLLNKKVRKLTVKDLKRKLKDMDDESDVVLTFFMKEEGLHSVYLAEVLNLGYDGVLKEPLNDSKVCELGGFNHNYCIYIKDDKNG